MENNMQTNPEQNNQKSYVTSDTSLLRTRTLMKPR